MLRLHCFHPIGHARRDALSILQSARVRSQRIIFSEFVKPERVRARVPLSIASNGYHEWSVCRFEQLIRNEIRVRVSPPLRISPRNQDVLRDVDESRTRAAGE